MSTSYSSPKQLTEDLLKTYRQMQKTESTVPTTPKMDGGKAGGGAGRKKKGQGGGGY
jgi:hypothetical protein